MAVTNRDSGFWLQHANREAPELVEFAKELSEPPPGIVFGPLNSSNTLSSLYQQARQSGPAIVDPQGHAIDRKHTKRAKDHFPWLVRDPRPEDQDQWEAWMQDGLDHQTSEVLVGEGSKPSFIVTPSPEIKASQGPAELHAVFDAAISVKEQLSDTPECWLGISVDRDYLREEEHLTRLANALLASGTSGVVFRASHSQLPPVDDRRYLEGLREIVMACSANDIRILLPSSGWLGWLALGWGAWGFTGGMAAGTWGDRVPSPMTPPLRRPQPYFEHQLLRTLPWRVHEELKNLDSYIPCQCSECGEMKQDWQLPLVKRHQLRHAHAEARLVMDAPLDQRSAIVSARIEAARSFRDELPRATKERAKSSFLDRWAELA